MRAPTHRDYGYPFSPLERYLTYEREFVTFDADRVVAVADRIADEAALQMLLRAGVNDIREAERVLWLRGDEAEIGLGIAELLRDERIVYTPESLLSRAFDPDLHRGDFFHLDCDLISHFFAHVGYRLDLNMLVMKSPLHAYVGYAPPRDPDFLNREVLYIEPTAFREIETEGGRVELMGRMLGDDFFIEADYHRSGAGGVVATGAMVEAAGFYQASNARELEDSIAANVLAGVSELAKENDDPTLRARVKTELEARLDGTRNVILINNLYHLYVSEARAQLDTSPDLALVNARAAQELRRRFEPLMIYNDRPEDQLVELADK